MKTRLLFAFVIFLMLHSCSKSSSIVLSGKWILTKSCTCNACSDNIPFYQTEAIVFSAGNKVELSGAFGNSVKSYSGTYSVTTQSYGKVLNIELDAPDSYKSFLNIPGSVISLETEKILILKLNTPQANVCAYQNTFTRVLN